MDALRERASALPLLSTCLGARVEVELDRCCTQNPCVVLASVQTWSRCLVEEKAHIAASHREAQEAYKKVMREELHKQEVEREKLRRWLSSHGAIDAPLLRDKRQELAGAGDAYKTFRFRRIVESAYS
jgi:hypothetical protein